MLCAGRGESTGKRRMLTTVHPEIHQKLMCRDYESSLAVLGESNSTPANNNGSTAYDHLAKVIGLHLQPAAAEHPLRLLQFLRF